MNTQLLMDTLHEQGNAELARFVDPISDNQIIITFTTSNKEDASDGVVSESSNGLTSKGLLMLAAAVLEQDGPDKNEQARIYLMETIAVTE